MMKNSRRTVGIHTLVRLTIGSLMILNAVACGGSSGTTTESPDSSLNGVWTTRTAGIVVSVTLAWTRDSVKGTGTYTVLDNILGCGGATLRGGGSLTFVAGRSGSTVSGHMGFDNGWTPPYNGALEENTHINGAFQSIDRGTCPFPLYFGLVP
jgi:hypothetical protein